MPRQGFVIYHDNITRIGKLTMEQKGKLLDALCAYSERREVQIDDSDLALWMVFDVMRDAIDRDNIKYENKSRAGKQNIAARWSNDIPTDTNPYQPIPIDTKKSDYIVNDTKFLTGTESESESETRAQHEQNECSDGGNPLFDDDDQTVSIRYCQNSGIRVNQRVMDEIGDFVNDGLPAELITLAADTAIANGSNAFAYMRTILERWRDAGIRTVEAAKAEQERFKAKKKVNAQEQLPPGMRFAPDPPPGWRRGGISDDLAAE